MRFGLLTTAALTLGMSAAIPSFAKADHVRDDRDHGRTEVRVSRDWHSDRGRDFHRDVYIERRPEIVRERVIVRDPVIISADCDQPVSLNTVPGCVLNTLDRQCAGRVETVQFVRRDGQTFYRFRVDARRGDLDVRIALDGNLLGIAPAA
jgi:hypothetical protein